jgi:hypothetical protein
VEKQKVTKMESRKKIIVILVIVAVLCAYFVLPIERVSAEKIKEMALDSVENIDTYKFDMDMTVEVQLSNKTSKVEMITTSSGSGVVDNLNKRMKMTTRMEMPEKILQKPMETEMYLFDNAIYMKVDIGIPGTPVRWIKMKIPDYEEHWESYNQLDQQMELLNISDVELLEDEEVNGVDCYVLKITPDLKRYWEIMMKQEGMSELMQNLKQNVSIDIIQKIIKEIYIKQWIAKDTKFLMKEQVQIKIVISSEDLNVTKDFTMTIEEKIDVIFYDYNKPVLIELPEEAKSALELPMMLNQTATTV